MRTTPYFDATMGVVLAADRFTSSPVSPGVRLGAVVNQRALIVARATLLLTARDTGGASAVGFSTLEQTAPSALVAGGVGWVVSASPSLVIAPTLLVQRTDVAAYGTVASVDLPLVWTLKGGMRIGMDLGGGVGVGGELRARCAPAAISGQVSVCDVGEERLFERRAGAVVALGFVLGWGYGYPGPTAPREARGAPARGEGVAGGRRAKSPWASSHH